MNNSFQFTHNQPRHFSFRQPQLQEYADRKHVAVIPGHTTNYHTDILPCFNWQPFHDSLLQQLWSDFWAPRLSAALANEDTAPALFPGHTIPGGASSIRFRGSLFYNQYIELSSSSNQTNKTITALQIKSLPIQNWKWHHVQPPKLYLLNSGITNQFHTKSNLQCLELMLQNKNTRIESLLLFVHQLWASSKSTSPEYSSAVIAVAEEIFWRISQQAHQSPLIAFIFELEALVSYASALLSTSLKPLAAGFFNGHWLNVSLIALIHCKPTELCDPERLFDELLSLSAGCFAPIVINQHSCVTDGNHRLTACWIWNLLYGARDCNWDLNDQTFQQRISELINSRLLQIPPVSKHECMHHLAIFLSNPELQTKLAHKLKPTLSSFSPIIDIPALVLPEHLSGAVHKQSYDQDSTINRILPETYDALAAIPNIVLPPRTAYHFTDCVPLPWFNVLPWAFHHVYGISPNLPVA